MESTRVEPQEPLLHDSTETSSELKQQAAPQSPFHTGSRRPYRDSTFTFLFLTAVLITFTFGIIASTRTDTLDMDTKLRLSNYNPSTNKCETTQPQTPEASDSEIKSASADEKLVALTSLSTLALTIPLSLLLVSLLRRYTQTLIVLSAPVMPLVFLGLGLSGGLFGGFLWFARYVGVPEEWGEWGKLGNKQIVELVFASCVLILLGYGRWPNSTGRSVESGVEALRMATGFWKEHFVLLVVNPVLLTGAMVLVNGSIFTFMWYASNVGEIVPDFDVVNDPLKGCGLATGIRCCREERPGWVPVYMTFARFTALWVLSVSLVLQYSVVSGTVSLWYFAPTGSSAIGNIKRALRNAYGPSFGRACNLGTIVTSMVVAPVRFFKKLLSDKLLKSKGQGMMSSILRGCSLWMSQFPDCYPQLSSIFLGVSESSKKAHPNLLQWNTPFSTAMTNVLDVVANTLGGMTFICAFLQILVVYGVLEYFTNTHVMIKFLIAVGCSPPIVMVGLGAGFYLPIFSVIKSVCIFYAMELDAGEISKPEVCRAFMTTTPSLLENGTQVGAEPVPQRGETN